MNPAAIPFVLTALLLSAGCATLHAEGAIGVAGMGPQGRDLAREAARAAARALGGDGHFYCELDHDGLDDRVTCVPMGPDSPDVRLEKRGARWWAMAEVLPRPPGWSTAEDAAISSPPLRAHGQGQGSEPGLAFAQAESRALATLVRAEVERQLGTRREGRYTLKVFPTRRGLRLRGERAEIALEALASPVAAGSLPAEARCALPRQTLRQRLGTQGAEGTITRLERAEAACGPLAGAVAASARRALLAGDTERGATLIGRLAAIPDELALTAPREPATQGEATRESPQPVAPARGLVHPPAASTASPTAPSPTAPSRTAPSRTAASPPRAPCPPGSVWLAGGAVTLEWGGHREVRQVAPFCLMVTEAWHGFPARKAGRWPWAAARWSEADAACRRAGGRLPRAAEWVFAAAGVEGRMYPWGDAPPDCARANTQECGGAAMAIGERRAGASPEGVLDLGGNLREWTADLRGIAAGGGGPDGPAAHVVRGGDFNSPAASARSPPHGDKELDRVLHDDVSDATVGFRCAFDAVR